MNDRINTTSVKPPSNIWNLLNAQKGLYRGNHLVNEKPGHRQSNDSRIVKDSSTEQHQPVRRIRSKRNEPIRKTPNDSSTSRANINKDDIPSRKETKPYGRMSRPEESIHINPDPTNKKIFDIRKVPSRLLSRKLSKHEGKELYNEQKPILCLKSSKTKKEAKMDFAEMSSSLNLNDNTPLGDFNYLNESSDNSQKEKEYLHIRNNLNVTTSEDNDYVYHAKDLKKVLAECFSILSRNYIFNKHLSDIEFKQPAEGKNIKGVYEDMLKMFGYNKNDCKLHSYSIAA